MRENHSQTKPPSNPILTSTSCFMALVGFRLQLCDKSLTPDPRNVVASCTGVKVHKAARKMRLYRIMASGFRVVRPEAHFELRATVISKAAELNRNAKTTFDMVHKVPKYLCISLTASPNSVCVAYMRQDLPCLPCGVTSISKILLLRLPCCWSQSKSVVAV